MKKEFKLTIKNIVLITLIIGAFAGGISYVAAEIVVDSQKIGYKDNSSIGATNVQDAIDKVCVNSDSRLTKLETKASYDTSYKASNIATINYTGFSIPNIVRYGHVVQMNIVVAGSNFEANTWYDIGTISKLKPASTPVNFVLPHSGGMTFSRLYIGTDGAIGLYVENKGAWYAGAITYITNDI